MLVKRTKYGTKFIFSGIFNTSAIDADDNYCCSMYFIHDDYDRPYLPQCNIFYTLVIVIDSTA